MADNALPTAGNRSVVDGERSTEPASLLQAWRLKNNLSLQDMSDLVGLSVTHLSRVERRMNKLAPLTKRDVASRLRVRIGDLFEVEPIEIPDTERMELADGDDAR